MNQEQICLDLVRLAQMGQKDSLDQLVHMIESRLRAYIYRVTLDYDLTQDLCQEALLEMVKSIKDLKKAGSFWPWLWRITQSKIQIHYRAKQRKKAFSMSAFYKEMVSRSTDNQADDGLRSLLQTELSKTVMSAMNDLKQQYRAVLSLRCFEDLSYTDIGRVIGCSEARARVLFFRSKQQLKKQLVGRGLGRGALPMCLGFFGRVTAPAEAASQIVTVAASSMKVGLTTTVVGAVGTKVGVAIVATAVGLAAMGGMSILSDSGSSLPKRSQVKSFHYTTQSRDVTLGANSSLSKGAFEQWYYFPDGVDGPIFMRMQRWTPQQTEKECSWLQDDKGNYYYHVVEKQVYINNYRLWLSSLRTRRLPTDTTEFTSFLSKAEGDLYGVNYSRDRKTGLLIDAIDDRFVGVRRFQTAYDYNTLTEEQFKYAWGPDVPVIDERDEMHKRGWTYFRITGEVDGKTVSGRGRIPFVFGTLKEHPPWLSLNIGDDIEILDTPGGAFVRDSTGEIITAYPSGAFFKGLPRPWMGMHTVDTVRRDAVMQRMPFITAVDKDDNVTVTLVDEADYFATVTYDMDMENDIIGDIEFELCENEDAEPFKSGHFAFSYLQNIDQAGDDFAEPVLLDSAQVKIRKSPGVMWLIYLAQGNLDKLG
jgi:RNA polymerase sigma-70 factor (ECF subfamily)